MTNTTIGYCAGLPEGTGTPALARAYGPVTAAVLPAPMAFFSLAPRQLPSTSLPTFDDHVSNQLGVHPDLYFDDVISCSAVGPDLASKVLHAHLACVMHDVALAAHASTCQSVITKHVRCAPRADVSSARGIVT